MSVFDKTSGILSAMDFKVREDMASASCGEFLPMTVFFVSLGLPHM